MTEWKEYKLGEIVTFQRGHDLPKDKMIDGGVPVAGSNGIIGYHNQFTKEGPGVTIGRSGNIGIPHYYPNAYWAHNTVLYIIDFKGNDAKFMYYLLKTFDFTQLNTGSAVPSLNRNHIHELPVSIPDVPTQRRIAATLSSLDDKIDLLHRENATLEQMAETLFRQWFVVEAKEEWEDVLLGDLIDIGSGKGLQRSEFVENGLYSILGANGEIGKTNKYLVSESDRVIYTGRVGTLGNVFRIENKKAWLSDNTLVVRPKDYYYFVYFVLKCARLQDFNVGSTQPLIRQSDIKEIEISLPDGNSLKAFEKECNDIYKKIDSNNNQIQTLIQTRDGLLPRLMGGEVKL